MFFKERERERERPLNFFFLIRYSYSALSKMRVHYSKMANLLAYASFGGVGFLGFRC